VFGKADDQAKIKIQIAVNTKVDFKMKVDKSCIAMAMEMAMEAMARSN
jgi:hypothetical protein